MELKPTRQPSSKIHGAREPPLLVGRGRLVNTELNQSINDDFHLFFFVLYDPSLHFHGIEKMVTAMVEAAMHYKGQLAKVFLFLPFVVLVGRKQKKICQEKESNLTSEGFSSHFLRMNYVPQAKKKKKKICLSTNLQLSHNVILFEIVSLQRLLS